MRINCLTMARRVDGPMGTHFFGCFFIIGSITLLLFHVWLCALGQLCKNPSSFEWFLQICIIFNGCCKIVVQKQCVHLGPPGPIRTHPGPIRTHYFDCNFRYPKIKGKVNKVHKLLFQALLNLLLALVLKCFEKHIFYKFLKKSLKNIFLEENFRYFFGL